MLRLHILELVTQIGYVLIGFFPLGARLTGVLVDFIHVDFGLDILGFLAKRRVEGVESFLVGCLVEVAGIFLIANRVGVWIYFCIDLHYFILLVIILFM